MRVRWRRSPWNGRARVKVRTTGDDPPADCVCAGAREAKVPSMTRKRARLDSAPRSVGREDIFLRLYASGSRELTGCARLISEPQDLEPRRGPGARSPDRITGIRAETCLRRPALFYERLRRRHGRAGSRATSVALDVSPEWPRLDVPLAPAQRAPERGRLDRHALRQPDHGHGADAPARDLPRGSQARHLLGPEASADSPASGNLPIVPVTNELIS